MYTGNQFNERVKQIGFILLLLFLGCLIVDQLRYFISAFLGAFTLYMVLRRPHKRLAAKLKSVTWSTAILMTVTFVVLFVVGAGLFFLVYDKIGHFHPQTIINGVQNIHSTILEKFDFNIFSEDIIQKAISFVSNIIPGIISTTGNVLMNLIMMAFVLFFMLQRNDEFKASLENLFPVSEQSVDLMKKETNDMVVSNAIVIPLVMLGQGCLAALGYWITGAGDPILWGVITAFFGLVPVVGTGAIWVPLAINLLIGGNIWQAILLVAWGALVISSVDNLIRMIFMKKRANVHPLVTLLGIILGMNLFGFWGIIFGPFIISGFMMLLKIYKNEFLTA
ncbi:AI-2E family transporter [Bacteroidales bacterium OttesenSCG-928-I14]|nr:AI-2E family transporter [Bacteroidales bacterium OttesenSCG-928-I14]